MAVLSAFAVLIRARHGGLNREYLEHFTGSAIFNVHSTTGVVALLETSCGHFLHSSIFTRGTLFHDAQGYAFNCFSDFVRALSKFLGMPKPTQIRTMP